jgi:hypothetical protein
MSSELKKPDLFRFNNPDHVEFHFTSYAIISRNTLVIDAPQLLTAYYAKIQQEDAIYKWLRSSEFTEKKAEVDHERGKVFSAMVGIIHSYEKHFDPSLRDHAKHVAHLVDNYGTLYEADYDAETAGIDSIVRKLVSADYSASVQALQLSAWIGELVRLNALFKDYVEDTNVETGKKPDITTKVARKQTDEALRTITRRVESLINLNGETTFTALIKDFNINVEHYNTLVHEHYGRLHARTDLSSGEIADIAPQTYTGLPIYVIPSVKLLKTEKDGTTTLVNLDFTRDFTVGYRNNVAPGTATLIISGIGKYVGEIITTFNIKAIEE